MMVSLDIYRPAAQEQLKSLGEQNNILTLPIIEGQQPADICQRAISAANLNGADIILFDTAGRTQIDLQMMSEIKQIENTIKPAETFLVADSLTGQVAASVAKEFKNTLMQQKLCKNFHDESDFVTEAFYIDGVKIFFHFPKKICLNQ